MGVGRGLLVASDGSGSDDMLDGEGRGMKVERMYCVLVF
jgi:hypothetical protein